MKPEFLTSWQATTGSVFDWIKNMPVEAKNETVWRGADGGYAVGDAAGIYEDDPEEDLEFWTDTGTVADWIDDFENR